MKKLRNNFEVTVIETDSPISQSAERWSSQTHILGSRLKTGDIPSFYFNYIETRQTQ